MTFNAIVFTLSFFVFAANAQVATRPAKVGDVHVYSVEQRTERMTVEETVTVIGVDADRIHTSHVRTNAQSPTKGLYGKDWSVYTSGSNGLEMSPPSQVLAFPLDVGKEWENSYDGTTSAGARLRIKMNSKISAKEKVVTPAGEFEAYRIDSRGFLNGVSFPGGWGILQKVWYAPSIDRVVRIEFKEQRTLGAENVTELKAFKPAD